MMTKETDEPKVTECWAKKVGLRPSLVRLDSSAVVTHRPAVLMWREDYEKMAKELGQLREHLTWISAVNNANSKRGDIYFASLQELLPEKEVRALIDKIIEEDTEAHDDEEAK